MIRLKTIWGASRGNRVAALAIVAASIFLGLWITQAGEGLSAGSIAEWVTGGVTALAVGLAWYELAQDRRRWATDRLKQRRDLVQVRLIEATHVEPCIGSNVRTPDQLGDSAFDIRFQVTVSNGSSGPIYDLTLCVDFAVPVSRSGSNWSDEHSARIPYKSALVRSGDQIRFKEAQFFCTSTPVVKKTWVEWTDQSVIRWQRSGPDSYPVATSD